MGEVIGHDLVAAALRDARGAAVEGPGVKGLDGVGRVPALQVGEGLAVRYDELKSFDVGVVGGWKVDVAQHAVGHRVPDLRSRVACSAEAVLASKVEMRKSARPVGGGRAGCGGQNGDRKQALGEVHTGQPCNRRKRKISA